METLQKTVDAKQQKIHDKATILIEALPYIRKYHNKIVVIKYGGKAIEKDRSLQRSVLTDVALLKAVGIKPILVHGGGPVATKMMQHANLVPKFIDGLRVTDEKTMQIVGEAFAKINQEIVSLLAECGEKTIGIIGDEIKLIQVAPISKELGYVGKVTKVNIGILKALINDNYIPVIAPIGIGPKNKRYNINADSVATAIAQQLKAEKLTLLTDVDGVYYNDAFVRHLSINDARRLIKQGIITGGMIPKVNACISAVQKGVRKAHLISGIVEHALLLEIFTNRGIGTEIVKKESSTCPI